MTNLTKEGRKMFTGKKWAAVIGLLVIASMVLTACGPAPTPEVVEKVVKETVVVKEEVQVEVVVTATPTPPAPVAKEHTVYH